MTGKTWHAYLSTSDADARDRIGKGPWFNAKGQKIADDVASLHSDANNINKDTALDEKGQCRQRPRRHAEPPRHSHRFEAGRNEDRRPDLQQLDQRRAEGAAMMGHHDRTGLDDSPAAKSWNSSHASRGGCSQEALKGTGGDGLFYCFAAN